MLVEAAPEPLLQVRSNDPLSLLRAAYHLGNRHVALELSAGELRLLQDSVLAELLCGLDLHPEAILAPFHPEAGAYGGHGHGPSNSHGPGNIYGPSNSHGPRHDHGPDHSQAPGTSSAARLNR